MSKHTPGPWTVFDPDSKCPDRWPGIHSPGSTIVVYGLDDYAGIRGKTPQEALANALLIAAAPDLLEALKYVLSAHGEQLDDAFDQAHKTIAKAEAQS